jgi:hypothetical protein
MPNFHYYQKKGGEVVWLPVSTALRDRLVAEEKPEFVTVLAVSKLIDEDTSYEDKQRLVYEGPAYFDWDLKKSDRNAEGERAGQQLVIDKVKQFLAKLVELKVDLEMCRLYATGGKGFHLEIPQAVFIPPSTSKKNNTAMMGLPYIYRELAHSLVVDTLDLQIYSAGKGRMWRTPNVQRDNGRYKVQISMAEMAEMTPEICRELTSAPRDPLPVKEPSCCIQLASLFDECRQKVEDLLEKRRRFKPDPEAFKRAQCESVKMAMAGFGLKPGLGFHQVALQLAVAATTGGLSSEQFVAECEGLVNSHQSDGSRYDTPQRRRDELARMHRYMLGNGCYEFGVGPLKSIMAHSAPDLDGIPVTATELRELAEEAATDAAAAAVEPEVDENGDKLVEMDEYKDVAAGISLSRFGVYKWTENGNKRICAVSFAKSAILLSSDSNDVVGYESEVMVNGQSRGRAMLELDLFSSLQTFNKWAFRRGHSFQGSDAEIRTLMMRFVEQAKKKGTVMYVAKREGLDVVSIPHHENPLFHEPFLIWADNRGVITSPEIAEAGLKLTYQGHPDPRGVFKTDISNAPALVGWMKEGDNADALKRTISDLISCQKSDLLGKLIGWYVACFYKQLFNRVYGKFPLLHVNGAAGVGKTETNTLLASLFFYRQEVRPLSPSSTTFALSQTLTSTASMPMIVDEYKPQELSRERHQALKLLFREAYNQRPVARGGGTREMDDYRALQQIELSGPLVFIAEATEDEAAVMERVVLVTFSRPPQATLLRNLAKFQNVRRNHEHLGIIGQYLAARIVRTATLNSFRTEFDELYETIKNKYLLTEADLVEGALTEDELREKQNAKERSVYNHAVALYGFRKFRELVNEMFAGELDEDMAPLEDGIFSRLADLNAATTPEHIKVIAELAQMSHHVNAEMPEAIRQNEEFALVTHGSLDCVEIAIIPAYGKYRMYCKRVGTQPLYLNAQVFMHSLRDSPAFVREGTGVVLQLPKVFTFNVDELAKYGVDLFKSK